MVVGYAILSYYFLLPFVEQVIRSFYASLETGYAVVAFIVFLIVMYLWFKHANTGTPRRRKF
jgi:predicted ferric reductase